jgi:hypothetical protein
MERTRGEAPNEQADSHRQITQVTRRDIVDRLRAAAKPWSGRLSEVDFLDDLYDLDALPSTDSRPQYPTAREDIWQHRENNYDWTDDYWVFEDSRFGLLDGPDEVLLKFLARMVHPEVQADVDLAARQVNELNQLLAPDGWTLSVRDSISGRPVYVPIFTGQMAAPAILLPVEDDDASKLDLVLGQTYHLLDADSEGQACDLLRNATLALRRDGGYFHPIPGDNWTAATSEAVLTVDAALVPEFTPVVQEVIWQHLSRVLSRLERGDVQSLVIEGALPPLPLVAQDWRQMPAPAPTNQARRERRAGEGYPTQDDLVFGSRAELVVYQVLTELQRDRPVQHAFAIVPLPSVKMRDAGVRSPDFMVIGNGRAVVIEVDGPHHRGRTRKADDADRDRHWERCGVRTVRIAHEYTEDRDVLKDRLREDFNRHLLNRG